MESALLPCCQVGSSAYSAFRFGNFPRRDPEALSSIAVAMSSTVNFYACFTTVSKLSEAESLAEGIIESRLAACVQIDSPITSYYRWEGEVEKGQELRLIVFAPEPNLDKLERFIEERHPYDTPKWVCCRAEKVSEKYLKWANEACNLRGFF
jgi:periplasmic divalent cation tolerance protein